MYNEFDTQFINNLKDILEKGTKYKSRGIWKEDGEQAECKKLFGVVNRYNQNYENNPPISVLRKLAIKNCIDELLWIWQKKSNNIHDLKSLVWDDWADENGSIGAAYGFQVASKLRKTEHEVDNGDSKIHVSTFLDQTDFVLHELKYNPFSRRIITNLYAIDETQLMGLDPCCYSCTWNVTEKDGKRYLNLLLNQRSQDMIVANNWNVFQYWILQNLFALECGLEVGELVHVIADCHIYDRHLKIATFLINQYNEEMEKENYKYPTVNIDFKGFYKTGVEDIKVDGYEYLTQIKNIPVAI